MDSKANRPEWARDLSPEQEASYVTRLAMRETREIPADAIGEWDGREYNPSASRESNGERGSIVNPLETLRQVTAANVAAGGAIVEVPTPEALSARMTTLQVGEIVQTGDSRRGVVVSVDRSGATEWCVAVKMNESGLVVGYRASDLVYVGPATVYELGPSLADIEEACRLLTAELGGSAS